MAAAVAGIIARYSIERRGWAISSHTFNLFVISDKIRWKRLLWQSSIPTKERVKGLPLLSVYGEEVRRQA